MYKKDTIGNEEKEYFLDLFQKYEKDVYRMAYVYVKNKDDALDIVQEVAYRSFVKYRTLKDHNYFKTWIIKITINCAIDLIRKNKKVILSDSDDKFISDTENYSLDIPLTLTLKELIDELNEDEKTILLLKYYKGYTFKNISFMLDTPMSTVKSHLYRGLKKLRDKARRTDMYG